MVFVLHHFFFVQVTLKFRIIAVRRLIVACLLQLLLPLSRVYGGYTNEST